MTMFGKWNQKILYFKTILYNYKNQRFDSSFRLRWFGKRDLQFSTTCRTFCKTSSCFAAFKKSKHSLTPLYAASLTTQRCFTTVFRFLKLVSSSQSLTGMCKKAGLISRALKKVHESGPTNEAISFLMSTFGKLGFPNPVPLLFTLFPWSSHLTILFAILLLTSLSEPYCHQTELVALSPLLGTTYFYGHLKLSELWWLFGHCVFCTCLRHLLVLCNSWEQKLAEDRQAIKEHNK